MENIASLLGILLTVILVPLVIRNIPYFKRPDVLARRAVKAKLPGWVPITEMLFLAISEVALISLFFQIEIYLHGIFHPGSRFIDSQTNLNFSFDSLFAGIEAFAPIVAALPLGMILANLISWSIPPIRKAENKIMGEGVPGYNWKDINMGLIKLAVVMIPVSMILAFISLLRK